MTLVREKEDHDLMYLITLLRDRDLPLGVVERAFFDDDDIAAGRESVGAGDLLRDFALPPLLVGVVARSFFETDADRGPGDLLRALGFSPEIGVTSFTTFFPGVDDFFVTTVKLLFC